MKLKFLRPLSGSYGKARRGQTLEVPEKVADDLLARGLCVKPTKAAPQTKLEKARENK